MGILVAKESLTYHGALLIVGIPLLATGKSRCNHIRNDEQQNSSLSSIPRPSFDCPFIALPFLRDGGTGIPWQWAIGIFMCYMALGIVIFDFVSWLKRRGKDWNKYDGSLNDDSDVIETDLIATYLYTDEIKRKIEHNIIRYHQLSFACDKGDESFSENHHDVGDVSNSKNGKSKKRIVQSVEQQEHIEDKTILYLDALAYKLSPKMIKRKASSLSGENVEDLYVLYQDVAYKALSAFPCQNKVICSALSLLALTAKHPAARRRNLIEKDANGVHIPIQAMRKSLKRSKSIPNPARKDELLAAELQRKGCLYLGALADEDGQDLSVNRDIVDNGGLEAILNAVDWFRFHDEVVNWGLWAIFMICFGHVENKKRFVRLHGIQKVCRVLRNILNDYTEIKKALGKQFDNDTHSSTMEAARHGVAILYDILRHNDSCAMYEDMDFIHMRRVALNAGLHGMLVVAMQTFSNSTEIMMMGQQMLIATGYIKDIPQYAGSIIPLGNK